VVFADLDGTLIDRDVHLGPAVRTLISKVTEAGGALIPVSAKPVPYIAELFSDVGDVSYVAGSGGAVIGRIRGGRLISVMHEEALRISDGRGFIDRLAHLSTEHRGVIFGFRGSSALFEVEAVGTDTALSREQLQLIAGGRPLRHSHALLDPCPLGVSLFAPMPHDRLLSLVCEQIVPRDWRVSAYAEDRIAGWSWLEVLASGANKAAACRRLLAHWTRHVGGQPLTVALGNSEDDIPMLRLADRSYCPSTATRTVQRDAQHVLQAPAGERFAAAVADRIADR
jgi:hydroxymethylpyrimidine pyrophosphatase-like HAD family hydrolase